MMDHIFGSIGSCTCETTSSSPLPWAAWLVQMVVTGLLGLAWLCLISSQLWVSLQSLPDWCSKWRHRQQPKLSKIEIKIEELFLRRRVERLASTAQTACHFVVPLLLPLAAAAVSQEVKQDEDPGILLNCARNGLALLASLIFLLAGKFPERITRTTIQIFYPPIFLLTGILPCLADDIFSYTFHSCLMFPTLVYLGFVYPDRRLSVVLSSLCLTWHAVLIFLAPSFSGNRVAFLAMPLLGFGYNITVSFATVTALIAEAEAEVHDREARSSFKSFESLLGMMCDAVVSLRPDLTLWEPSPSLNTMLFRAGPLKDGQHFPQLLARDDVERFEAFVSTNSREIGRASVLHADLLDSMGSKVPVQIFHTCTIDLLEECFKHVLGLVECTQSEHFPTTPKSSVAAPVKPGVLPRGPAEYQLSKPPSDEEGSLVAAVSSSSRGSPSETPAVSAWRTAAAEGEATVRIRTWLDFDILDESMTSRAYFGFSGASSEAFLARFRNPQKLVRWMEYIHIAAGLGHCDQERSSFGEVDFLDTTGGFEYRGTMRAIVRQMPPRGLAEGRMDFDFDPKMRFVDVDLQIHPPRLRPSTPNPHRGLRQAGPLSATILGNSMAL